MASIEIFFCYAHEDENLRQGLGKQLRALKRQGLIDTWHDRNISAGTEWEREIDKHLNTAQVILLLISPDFMDSDYCYSKEMKRAIERHEQKDATVIPVILRPVYWQGAPFGRLQALPTDAIPVTDPIWHNMDRALFNVSEGVREVVEARKAEEERVRKVQEERIRVEMEEIVYKTESLQHFSMEKGQVVERYHIVQCLGCSVSGESYEADDMMLHRKVTLKLILPQSELSDGALQQFFREMQGISVLNHPYLAPLLDYGVFDRQLYVVRRFVSNGSLLDKSGRSWFHLPLSIPDAIQYTYQLAQSLQYMHNRGIVHGSLTLSNILVLSNTENNTEQEIAPFLLADVGLTSFVRRFGQQQQQQTSHLLTAAPEHFIGRVIPASDQYSLAVLLYIWLTSRPPYFGTPQEVEDLKLTGMVMPPSTFNPCVSIDQDEILLQALSSSPIDRYTSVLAFAQALRGTLVPKD